MGDCPSGWRHVRRYHSRQVPNHCQGKSQALSEMGKPEQSRDLVLSGGLRKSTRPRNKGCLQDSGRSCGHQDGWMGGHGAEFRTTSDMGFLILLCWLFLCSPYQMLACAGTQHDFAFQVNGFHTKQHLTLTIMSTESSTWWLETSAAMLIISSALRKCAVCTFCLWLGVWSWTNWAQAGSTNH